MQKIQPFVMTFISLVCAAIFLTVGAFAAISHTVAVNVSVNYTPPVKAIVKMATNTNSYNYGVDGEGMDTLYYQSGATFYKFSNGEFNGGTGLTGGSAMTPSATEECCYVVMDNVNTEGIQYITGNSFTIAPLANGAFQNAYNDLGVLVIFLEVINYTLAYNVSCKVTVAETEGTFTSNILFDGASYGQNTYILAGNPNGSFGTYFDSVLVTIELRTSATTNIVPTITLNLEETTTTAS